MIKKTLIICVLGFLLYAPTLKAPFVFDEHLLLTNNHLTQNLYQGLEGLREIWSFQPSRFLTNLTLAVNFYFHQLDVLGYHFVNILIHLLTTFGVWRLTR